MTVEQNVAILRSKARRAPADNKERIEKIVSLYSMRKIRDMRTAQLMDRRNPNDVLDRYETLVAKFDGLDILPQLVPLPKPTREPPTIDVPRRPARPVCSPPPLLERQLSWVCIWHSRAC